MYEKLLKYSLVVLFNLFFLIFLLVTLDFLLSKIIKIPSKTERINYYKSSYKWPWTSFEFRQDPFSSNWIAHPLWGFSNNPDVPPINNYGFFSKFEYPYEKNKKDVVVALFGGSVAEQLSYDLKNFLDASEMLKEIREEGYRVVLINLSLGASKSPQSFYIFLHTYDWFDISINLDGWNDSTVESSPAFPIDFPTFTEQLYFYNHKKIIGYYKNYFFRKLHYHLIKFPIKNKWLKHSALFYLSYRRLDSIFKRIELSYERYISNSNQAFYLNHPMTTETRDKALIDNWVKYVHLQHIIEAERDRPHYFFIQPSQYTIPLKNMTDSESEIAIEKDLHRVSSVATT